MRVVCGDHYIDSFMSSSNLVVIRSETMGEIMAEWHEVLGLLLVHKDKALCDDCVTRELRFPRTVRANGIARQLRDSGRVERDEGSCGICGDTRQVTQLSCAS